MSNPHETLARRAKAERLAHKLFVEKITAAQVLEYFGLRQWQELATICGVNEPSPETAEMVVQILREKEGELASITSIPRV